MTKRIIALAHDPGGANAIAVSVSTLRSAGFTVDAFAIGPAVRQFKRLDVPCNEIGSIEILKAEISNCGLLIVGTSALDRSEVLLSEIAQRQGVPVLAILDYWANYRKRFSLVRDNQEHFILPDLITALDNACASEMVVDGIPESRIVITGQPYFGWLCNHTIRNMAYQEEKDCILFASEPHPAAKSVLKIFIKVMQLQKTQKKILIRFHPRQKDCLDSLAMLDNAGLDFTVDHSEDLFATLRNCDFVIGLTSIILIEAALLGIPAGSLLPPPWANPLRTNLSGLTTPLQNVHELNEFLKRSYINAEREKFQCEHAESQENILKICKKLYIRIV